MHLPEANLPVTRSLSNRMARWGLVIVGIYLLVALITPLLVNAWRSFRTPMPAWRTRSTPVPAGPIGAAPTGSGRDVCVRTMAGSGVALQVVLSWRWVWPCWWVCP